MAALIAFYSRAGENYFGGAHHRISVGNTEKAAGMLADLTGGELYKIEQAQPYSDDYNTCTAEAKAHLRNNARPEVLNLPDDLDAYDEIYLGYPNYWGTMPMAVYTFLEHYDLTGKTIPPPSALVPQKSEAIKMAFSIRLTDEEKKLADSYAKLRAMSVGEAFKRALFEKIEDEYDVAVAEEAHQDYLKSGEKSRPAGALWKDLGI